jgi:predicted alpha-1,6-mannanase (GH76 family)
MRTARLLRTCFWTIFACCAVQSACPQTLAAPPNQYLENATQAMRLLQGWYTPANGLYATTGWWHAANILTVLADYARVSGSKQYDGVFANSLTAGQRKFPGFLNKFYDDEGWWALAWIDAYDLTRNPKFLSMAESIFADMAGGWDNTCSGGIWWSKDRRYKNAIANELFLSVAAHLANRTTGDKQRKYLDWAHKEWTWFQGTGMINAQNLINDGLGNGHGITVGAGCKNNGQTTWSYNQGVVLGGLTELAIADHSQAPIEAADKIATAAITLLVDSNGILHDHCEPRCGGDGEQFKGILVRNLVALDLAHPKPAYKTFVDANADSIWKNAQGPGFALGMVWSGPFGSSNAGIQSSALDAIVGATILERPSH